MQACPSRLLRDLRGRAVSVVARGNRYRGAFLALLPDLRHPSPHQERSQGMPIVRWYGWAAKCRRCKQLVKFDGDEILAYQDRNHVRDAVTDCQPGRVKIEESITEICGCQDHRKGAPR